MTPDNVCKRYCDKAAKVSIIVEGDMVYIKGDHIGLEFLGNLILAQSDYKDDDGFHITPKGAGKIFFREDSDIGIYIQRIDTENF